MLERLKQELTNIQAEFNTVHMAKSQAEQQLGQANMRLEQLKGAFDRISALVKELEPSTPDTTVAQPAGSTGSTEPTAVQE